MVLHFIFAIRRQFQLNMHSSRLSCLQYCQNIDKLVSLVVKPKHIGFLQAFIIRYAPYYVLVLININML